MKAEELQQNFNTQQTLMSALQRYQVREPLSVEEKRLLVSIACYTHQLSFKSAYPISSKKEKHKAKHPLEQDIAHIHAMSDEKLEALLPAVRELFEKEDLLWAKAGETLGNLDDTAEALMQSTHGLDEAVCRDIQASRAHWRSVFVQMCQQKILEDLWPNLNQRMKRYWIEEYIESLRSHLMAWQNSTLAIDNPTISLMNCDLRHVDLSGISLADVTLQGSTVRGANLQDTDISAAQLAQTIGFSEAQGVSVEIMEATRAIGTNHYLARLEEQEALLASIKQDCVIAEQISKVSPDGNLELIDSEQRVLVQWAVLTNDTINTLQEESVASVQALNKKGKAWFLNLSPQERDNYWKIFLTLYRLELPVELLAEAQCSQFNFLRAQLERLSFTRSAKNEPFNDLRPAQQETINARQDVLIAQQQKLQDEQDLLLEQAHRQMFNAQLAKIETDLNDGCLEQAKVAFSKLISLAKRFNYRIDLRDLHTSADLFKGISLDGIRLFLEPGQLSQLTLAQRRAHSAWLFKAIDARDEKVVRQGVEEACWEIDLHNEAGHTPLMRACFKKELAIAQYLHSMGADINARIQREGDSENANVLPGIVGVLPQDLDYRPIVESLLAEGIEVNLEDALTLAIVFKDPSLFEKNLEKQKATTAELQKLARIAVQKGSVEVIQWFVMHRKESLQQSEKMLPLLHLACAEGHTAIVKLLLEAKKTIHVNGVDKSGRTALVYLAEQYLDRYQSSEVLRSAPTAYYTRIADLLCQNGAKHTIYTAIVLLTNDVQLMQICKKTEEVCDSKGNKPLHIAVRASRLDAVDLILAKEGAQVDNLTAKGETALQLACEMGCKPIVEFLLRAGANPNGARPVLSAEQEQCLLLLKNRESQKAVPPSEKRCLQDAIQSLEKLWLQSDRETPLHLTAKAGNVILVRLLCDFKADVEAKNNLQQTPLHLAVKNGCAEVVEVLLHYGARVTTTEAEGSLPTHLAMRSGHADLIPRLEQAFMAQKDRSGTSILDLAKTEAEKDICSSYISVHLPAENAVSPNIFAGSSSSPLFFSSSSSSSSSAGSSSSSLPTTEADSKVNDAQRTFESLHTHIGPRIGNRKQIGHWPAPANQASENKGQQLRMQNKQ